MLFFNCFLYRRRTLYLDAQSQLRTGLLLRWIDSLKSYTTLSFRVARCELEQNEAPNIKNSLHFRPTIYSSDSTPISRRILAINLRVCAYNWPPVSPIRTCSTIRGLNNDSLSRARWSTRDRLLLWLSSIMGHSFGLGTSQKEMVKPWEGLGTCSCQGRGLVKKADIPSGFRLYRCDISCETSNCFVGTEIQITSKKRTRGFDRINIR